jgi:hypothetical protein
MKNIYLVLAIVGAAVPYYFFVQHFGTAGYALPDFLAGVFATPAASGFASDLLITSLVFWIYMINANHAGPKPWLFIALNLLVGLSCALPAYLYARERAQERLAVQT